ncbi:probable heat shock protein homolog C338.06c at C-terminar half [Coccomyxa sp. Obi]|nr:probable heat shock protein homolog C338.06c at C-terminar half [Coccomyxa sp. Obi]
MEFPASARRRIACLAAQITFVPDAGTAPLSQQECAANMRIHFARPSAFDDLKFARVGKPEAHDVHRDTTALEFAEQALRKGSNHFQQIPDPPAFARPALEDPAASVSNQPAGPKPAKGVQAPTRVPRLTSTRFFQPRLTAGWAPKVDAIESDSHYQLEVALPGIRKEDLRVELWGSFLTVSGTRAGAAMGLRRPRARPMGARLVLRRELDHGFFSATWKLPANGMLDSLYAESVDGILRITMRKRSK